MVYDALAERSGGVEVWSLALARRCYSQNGDMIHFPLPGAAWEQDENILNCVRVAWRVYRFVFHILPSGHIPQSERNFLEWLHND